MKTFQIKDLTVAYLKNPIGISAEDVRFSWSMESERVSMEQEAWRIRIYSDRSLQTLLWDSKEREGNLSVGIPYDGEVLAKGRRYYWNVEVTGSDGSINCSDAAYFEIAEEMDDAVWILAENNSSGAPFFRTEFKLQDKEIKGAFISATAMGVYEGFINGMRLHNENADFLNPGWTDYRRYVHYQTFDAAPLLRRGSVNAIGIMVGGGWYQSGFMTDYSGVLSGSGGQKKRGIALRLTVEYTDGSRENITTGDTAWKYTDQTPFVKDDFYNGEVYDARIAERFRGWTEPGFDDRTWSEAFRTDYIGKLRPGICAGVRYADDYNRKPGSGYIYRDSEMIPGSGTAEGLFYGSVVRHPVDTDREIHLKKGDVLILDLVQNMVGHTVMQVSGTRGTNVRLRFAEFLNDGRKPSADSVCGSDGPEGTLYRIALRSAECTDHYILSGKGKEDYEQTFTYRGFRYVEISASEEIVLWNLIGRVMTSVKERSGFIATSDPDLNRLAENSVWSEMGNYLSIPTDCPQRDERAGWSGDAGVFAQTAALNFNVNAFLQNYIEVMNDYRRMYGVYGPTMPDSDFSGWKTSGWSDAGVIIPWVMYLQTGDLSFIERSYPDMAAYMNADHSSALPSASFRSDMDADTGYSGILFGDWLAYSGASLQCVNMLFKIYTLQLMSTMSQLTGRMAEMRKYEQELSLYRRKFIDKYIDEEYNLLSASADNAKEIDSVYSYYPVTDNAQTAILWALKLNLYDDETMRDALIRRLLENIRNKDEEIRPGQNEDTLSVGFLGVNIILPVLSDIGYAETAYDLLLQDADPSWLYAVKNGATTNWERWNSYSRENGFGSSIMNSFNHYAYGSCAEWMYHYMLGICPDPKMPGYKHVILQPTADPGGRIDKVEGRYRSLYGEITAGWKTEDGKMTSYHVSLPANTTAVLYLPETFDVREEELPKEIVPMGTAVHNEMNCRVYCLPGGSWEFEAV